jgi:anti-sigma regulatory factor (Ser/Thr protein kinase)
MAVITLDVAPDPAHARVIRLVAAAVARRVGLDEDLIDEIKLAVGEACGLAVTAAAKDQRLVVELDDTAGLDVVVRSGVDLRTLSAPDADTGLVPDAIAIIRGLIDHVEISRVGDGSVLRMTWPSATAAATPPPP